MNSSDSPDFSKHVSLNLNVRGLKKSATVAINDLSNKLIAEGKAVYKLGLGQSPFSVPAIVVEALRNNANQRDYLPSQGLPPSLGLYQQASISSQSASDVNL